MGRISSSSSPVFDRAGTSVPSAIFRHLAILADLSASAMRMSPASSMRRKTDCARLRTFSGESDIALSESMIRFARSSLA